MRFLPTAMAAMLGLAWGGVGYTQDIGAARLTPDLVGNIDRPLRYRPDHGDFVIENGNEFFNRPLYGGNTAFRVEGGDKPEFVLYLPGRGGNLRLAVRAAGGATWLHTAAKIETRYRPGELIYTIRDPLLGPEGVLRVTAVAYAASEGLGVRVEPENIGTGVELVWAYGGVNGERGKRDGDIGTESVPISEWFQLRPEFCRGNLVETGAAGTGRPNGDEGRTTQFTVRAPVATIVGEVSQPAKIVAADVSQWNDLPALARAIETGSSAPARPIAVGQVGLANGTPVYLSLDVSGRVERADLTVYREVTARREKADVGVAADAIVAGDGGNHLSPSGDTGAEEGPVGRRLSQEMAARFEAAEAHFAALRDRVSVDTPDPFINAAVGALNVAADAVWDEPQHAIMHGAIAWRTRLLGWRGPYALDALGWHERFRENAEYWFGRQNTAPIPPRIPPPEEKWNLARNEAGLHTNGDISNSHYDMNLVFIDAVFRHLQWTGDMAFARKAWPVIQRHLAWERRLFRREFGPEKLPLYEAYAAIWASDDLQYSGGGAMHASAYNYYENRQAARLARMLGKDPTPYDREADLIARAVRELLWVKSDDPDGAAALAGSCGRGELASRMRREGTPPTGGDREPFGWFAEYKDWLGEQRVHPSAALWTYYHTIDSELPTPEEAWQMTDYVDACIPHLPVRGPGVPDGLCTLATSNWMPYDWSINNVVMAEAVHAALAMWEAGRSNEAFAVMKGSTLAAMYMGICPGNVGSMSYLDVYRRESQRDFADGAGVLSRAIVEGLFGVKIDRLANEVRVVPGWPAEWKRVRVQHPDFSLEYVWSGASDRYVFQLARGEVATGRASENGHAATSAARAEKMRPGAAALPAADAAALPLALRLQVVARRDRVADVLVNGTPAAWNVVADSIGEPHIEITAPAAVRWDVTIRWAGNPIAAQHASARSGRFTTVEQGQMHWLQPVGVVPNASTAKAPVMELTADAALTSVVARADDAKFKPVDLALFFNDRVTQIFKNEYRSPRSPFVSLALPKQGIGGWAGGVNRTAAIDDSGLRSVAARNGGKVSLASGLPFLTPAQPDSRNVIFTSQWDRYPHSVTVPVAGSARAVYLLMAGSTDPMQSRFENGTVVVTYEDGTTSRLPLVNPINWWPIDQDYFIDDFQFRRPGPLPIRIDLRTGQIRELEPAKFEGTGRTIPGGAATVLRMSLDSSKALKSLTVRATANDVVIGLMAATLAR